MRTGGGAESFGAERVVSIVSTDEDEVDLNHQLGVTSGARADEVGSGRRRSFPSAGRHTIPDRAGSVLRAHFCGTVP